MEIPPKRSVVVYVRKTNSNVSNVTNTLHNNESIPKSSFCFEERRAKKNNKVMPYIYDLHMNMNMLRIHYDFVNLPDFYVCSNVKYAERKRNE